MRKIVLAAIAAMTLVESAHAALIFTISSGNSVTIDYGPETGYVGFNGVATPTASGSSFQALGTGDGSFLFGLSRSLDSTATPFGFGFGGLSPAADTRIVFSTASTSPIALTYNGPGSLLLPATAPEPATWAMMITGFGAIGATMRRCKVAVSFA